MSKNEGKHQGVGASVLRLEDDRYLRGRGRFIADIRMPGMLDVAFVRSPLAHGRIRGIVKPEGHESSVFVTADLAGVGVSVPIQGCRVFVDLYSRFWRARRCATSANRSLSASPTAVPKPRISPAPGARSRRIAGGCRHDARPRPEAPLIHAHWSRTCFSKRWSTIDFGLDECRGVKSSARSAPRVRAWRRIEGRGVVADWDNRRNRSWSIPRRRCRTSSATASPIVSASIRAMSASSRPMSAAALATRASCCRRRSASLIWRCNSTVRCAGSRTGVSS